MWNICKNCAKWFIILLSSSELILAISWVKIFDAAPKQMVHSDDRDKSACFRSFIIFHWYSMSWGVHHSISVPLDRGGFCDITIRGVRQLTRRRRRASMAGRTAVGAAVRAVNKPRKFAARRAAITLVSLTNSRIFLLRLNSRHTGQQ